MSILIDSGTVSAAEFLAVALKDNGRATLFGTKTKGYGATKQDKTLPNGYTFRIIVATNLSPTRYAWLANKVSPHQEVALSEEDLQASRLEPDMDRRLARDTQLAAAIQRVLSPLPK